MIGFEGSTSPVWMAVATILVTEGTGIASKGPIGLVF